jgi:gamma-glutamyl:cysteine ligase YbdK (ATP-grasp superfamily)
VSYRLFEVTGVELEYMIVGRDDLCVRSLADELIRAKCGSYESEIESGEIAWSNELALHVLELKTNGPARSLAGLARAFERDVREANALLAPLGARLLPSGMHPWMDPHAEFRLWPHEHSPVYEALHRIFDCRGHGWANLQSVHLNLPFQGDEEFGRLHAAIRVLLPILPGLAASSPVVEGARTGFLDSRLEVYRGNASRVPSVAGDVVPEPVFGIEAYQEQILGRIYADLAPFDPEGVLRHEWVNSRGCIPRFDRGSIEIRVLDVQECPRADLAVAAAVIGAARALCEEKLSSGAAQRRAEGGALGALFQRAVRDADAAVIGDRAYLSLFDYTGPAPCSVSELWADLLRRGIAADAELGVDAGPHERILTEGCLARRISRRLGERSRPESLRAVYAELAACLEEGTLFRER